MSVEIEKLKELFFRYEDALLEKSVLVGVAPESMAGAQLSPEFYDDDGDQHIKVTVLLELTGDETLDEDAVELVADTTSDWLQTVGINEELETLGIEPDVLDWFAVEVTRV